MLEEKDMMKILSYILISLIQVINLFKFKYACHIKRLILIQKWSCTNNVTQRPWCKLLNTWIRCINHYQLEQGNYGVLDEREIKLTANSYSGSIEA